MLSIIELTAYKKFVFILMPHVGNLNDWRILYLDKQKKAIGTIRWLTTWKIFSLRMFLKMIYSIVAG